MNDRAYKVVELSVVTDEAIEGALNEWCNLGYTFDGMHFVVREGSRRPTMAFLVFLAAQGECSKPERV